MYTLPYQPTFPPTYRPQIGIIGCGNIVRNEHLRAYQKYGIPVGGVYDINPHAIRLAQARYDLGQIYENLDDLLADPTIEVVDIATHPAERVALILKALAAGKHILAQKPLALDVPSAQLVIAEAHQRHLKVAVNQNGRWSPPWRIATLLIEQGEIGDVFEVTHYFDTNWLFYDYAIHWFDITRCWMGQKSPTSVRARKYRTPNQRTSSMGRLGRNDVSQWLKCHDPFRRRIPFH